MSMSRYTPGIFQHRSLVGLAHVLWSEVVKPGDITVDATCGRGFDSIKLAELSLTPTSGWLYCFDIQDEAIEKTKTKLIENGFKDRITYIHDSHESFPSQIEPESVTCIAYNLGYLPGFKTDKSILTTSSSTQSSILAASHLLKVGGLISVICYPGHAEGKLEVEAVESTFAGLPNSQWRVFTHSPFSRNLSPILYTAYKISQH